MHLRILCLLLILFVLPAWSHSGGLNAADCHNNSSRAEYHCHPVDSNGERGEGVPLADIEGRVVAVFDGDTIKVLTSDLQSFKIRLAGIDAPERDQAFGSASKQHLAAMVAGQQVRVESIKHDRYGRILAKVWVRPADCAACGKTLNTNHAQILDGMAWWYRYYAEDQSEEDRGRYESAEQEARARKWGLWADPDPMPPWDWRRRK
ncbi:MAG: thermonuclease family protein [Halioglobus sp.]